MKINPEDFAQLSTGAKKDLQGKSRLDLVPPEMIMGISHVLTYGTYKYAARNWEKGIPFMTSYAAAMRHLLTWASGTDLDEESGLHHLKHALCNLGMIITQIERERLELDDRPGIQRLLRSGRNREDRK